MCAYNKVNGTYASEHHWLLTEVLRDEWGFDGLVVSDWGAVHDRVAALAAGLDLQMPPPRASRRRASSTRSAPASWTRRCSTSPSAGCCGWSSGRSRRWPRTRPFDVDAHHALAREAAAESVGAAEERRQACCRFDRSTGPVGGDRRVRADAALPGRGQLAGRARRGSTPRWTRRPSSLADRGRLRAGLHDRGWGGRRTAGRGGRGRPLRRHRRRLPRTAGVGRVRGLRPRAHLPAAEPARGARRRRRGERERRRRALERLRRVRVRVAGQGDGRPRRLAPRPGRRLGDGRSPFRRRESVRAS